MTDRIDTTHPQQTICDDCGRWIDHNAAQWTDDGASYCTSCRIIPVCDRIDTAKNRLLPCPFCNGEAERITLEEDEPSNAGGDVICCRACGASSHVEFGFKENLESAWNRRPALDAKDAEIERLRAALMFYADNKNWNDGKLENDQPNTLTLVPSSAMSDCGRVARAALTPGARRD